MVLICLDANVLLRAVAAPGGPQAALVRRLLSEPGLDSVVSPEIVAEWRANALKPSVQRYFARRGVEVTLYLSLVEALVEISTEVLPSGEPPPCRDEDDRKYLHVAETSGPLYVVTADMDLLESSIASDSAIVSAWEMMRLLDAGA